MFAVFCGDFRGPGVANFLFFEYNEKVKSTGTSVQPGEEDEKVFYSD